MEVGPSFLGPGETAPGYQLIVTQQSGVQTLRELTGPESVEKSQNVIGYLVASQSSQAIRDAVETLNESAPTPSTFKYRPVRYETIDLGLDDLRDGKINAFVADPLELGNILEQYSSLVSLGNISTKQLKSFVLGTNQLGQDVLSRIIGARGSL